MNFDTNLHHQGFSKEKKMTINIMLCGYRIFSNDAIAIQQHMLIAISMECSDGCPL